MIKQTENGFLFQGTGLELLSEYTHLTRGMYESLLEGGWTEDRAKDVLKDCIEFALLSEEELKERAAEAEERAEKLFNKLKEFLGK